MRPWKRWILSLLPILAVAVSGCAPHQIYRTDYSLCVSDVPETECEAHALQEYRGGANPEQGYRLHFVEFDDQGQVFDRQQMRAVMDSLFELASPEDQDLLMVVFVLVAIVAIVLVLR